MNRSQLTQSVSTAETVSPTTVNPDSISWKITLTLLYYVLPISLVLLLIGGPPEHLVFGWFYFLLRTLPRVSFDTSTAMLGAICALAFVALFHATATWFFQALATHSTAQMKWSWRSTLVASFTFVLLFVSGTAMVGATHQTIWLITGKPDQSSNGSPRALGLFTAFVEASREAARRTMEKNNLKELGLGVHNSADIIGFLPPGGIVDESGTLLHGWSVFIASGSHYTTYGFNFAVPWNQPPNDRLYKCALQEFINPAQPGPIFDSKGYGYSHVAANLHLFPIRQVSSKNLKEHYWTIKGVDNQSSPMQLNSILDGTSQTIMVGTAAGNFKPWGHPANVRDPGDGINRTLNGFGGPPNWPGAMFLMCDGSVRFMSDKTDPQVMKALATPAGGEKLPKDALDR